MTPFDLKIIFIIDTFRKCNVDFKMIKLIQVLNNIKVSPPNETNIFFQLHPSIGVKSIKEQTFETLN
jgi:hypothetical protein